MLTGVMIFLGVGLALGVGVVLGRSLAEKNVDGVVAEKKRLASEIEAEALRRKESIIRSAELEARELAFKAKVQSEEEANQRRQTDLARDQALKLREASMEELQKSLDSLKQKLEKDLEGIKARERLVASRESSLEEMISLEHKKLEEISGLSLEESRERLLREAEDLIRIDVSRSAQKLEREAKENAQRKSREIMTHAIQRYANDHVAEVSVSVVPIASEDVKGRIIGREGRNIRAFQLATGVDLIIDDTPDAIIISGFDPLRREVAKIALERLLVDGRVHPSRIEEVVDKVRKELDQTLKEEAERVAFSLGISDIHPEILKLVGKLKFRTSYGQNNLLHAQEVANLASMMASELGIDAKLAKRAAFLHDIGKSLTHENEGTHPQLGAEAARKYGESEGVINAIASHHGDVEPSCLESVLVAAADAISAARPGARRESMDAYLKRLEKLEDIANSFKGVEKAYAIQAGREIRIIVKQDEINDEDLSTISREIAKKIESELTYPGQIRVTVIRESRIVEYAR
jgi:ribonuclease Y